jgi:hypothetical protein
MRVSTVGALSKNVADLLVLLVVIDAFDLLVSVSRERRPACVAGRGD